MSAVLPLPSKAWRSEQSDGFSVYSRTDTKPSLTFEESIAQGLESHPRFLDCRFLYDTRGSEIYEDITRQPEYYLTRAEDEILAKNAEDIRARVGDTSLVELGSGTSLKTKRLLRVWEKHGQLRYFPIDISPSALRAGCEDLRQHFPNGEFHAVASTYEQGLEMLPKASPALLMFLGSTLGNFNRNETDAFFEHLARSLSPNDWFLLGVDMVKSPTVLEAAYNDAAGHSAAFTTNLFARMERELGLVLPPDAAEHVAFYNQRMERIEIYLSLRTEVHIELPTVKRRFRLAPGERILVEISRKFRVHDLAATAARFGFALRQHYTDSNNHFTVLLLQRLDSAPLIDNRNRELANVLRSVRRQTKTIVEPLADEHLQTQFSPLMSPIAWDLGHIAHFEDLWLRRVLDAETLQPPAESEDAVYDALETPRADRNTLPVPTREKAKQMLDRVRKETEHRMLHQVRAEPRELYHDGYVYRMVAQHEAQHQETILQTLQLQDAFEYDPAWELLSPERPEAPISVDDEVRVPSGEFMMGTRDRGAAYDNERPLHAATLPAYYIDTAPVTNGAFLEFMQDGGYRNDRWWCGAGKAWRDENVVQSPLYWQQTDGNWQRRKFGRWVPVDASRPVQHVSWYEAKAYAAWVGKRLPTETEWEKAAAWDPSSHAGRKYPWGDRRPNPQLVNIGQNVLEPTAVGSYPRGRSFFGCHQMLGDVWEWTSSWFQPYPGFKAFPYKEYSEVFFGEEYRVLRGGSWATHWSVARNTIRNWDFPQRRQIFAGFRCARDG